MVLYAPHIKNETKINYCAMALNSAPLGIRQGRSRETGDAQQKNNQQSVRLSWGTAKKVAKSQQKQEELSAAAIHVLGSKRKR